MDAGREGEMAVGVAGDVEHLRIVERRRIAVGGADAQCDEGAGRAALRRRSRVARVVTRLPSWLELS